MNKGLRIKLLSLLCLPIIAGARPLPGIRPASATATAGMPSSHAYSNVTVYNSNTIHGNSSVTITQRNLGASSDFDFTFKHAMAIGTVVAAGALVIAIWDARYVLLDDIKAFWQRISG